MLRQRVGGGSRNGVKEACDATLRLLSWHPADALLSWHPADPADALLSWHSHTKMAVVSDSCLA